MGCLSFSWSYVFTLQILSALGTLLCAEEALSNRTLSNRTLDWTQLHKAVQPLKMLSKEESCLAEFGYQPKYVGLQHFVFFSLVPCFVGTADWSQALIWTNQLDEFEPIRVLLWLHYVQVTSIFIRVAALNVNQTKMATSVSAELLFCLGKWNVSDNALKKKIGTVFSDNTCTCSPSSAESSETVFV